jgi:hypothetical protein
MMMSPPNSYDESENERSARDQSEQGKRFFAFKLRRAIARIPCQILCCQGDAPVGSGTPHSRQIAGSMPGFIKTFCGPCAALLRLLPRERLRCCWCCYRSVSACSDDFIIHTNFSGGLWHSMAPELLVSFN